MTDEQTEQPGSVTRTFRASLRIGDDFYTLEESITLPLDASDDQIAQAVNLGWRIYQSQHQALEEQLASVRESHPLRPTTPAVREPDAPATDKQRGYIATLQNSLAWSNEELGNYASDQGLDLVQMTRGQASSFIDRLKKVAEERGTYQTERESSPMTERQEQALVRLAEERGFDLEAAVAQRLGVAVADLTRKQAGDLIVEWQRASGR